MAVNLLICALCCGGATIVQTVSGFGFGIIVMALMPHFISSTTACATLVGIICIVSSILIAWRHRKKLNVKMSLLPLIVYFPVSYLVIHSVGVVQEGTLRKMLGIVLILLSLYFFFFSRHLHIKPAARNGLIAGAVSAVLGGLFSTGGPPMAVYNLAISEDDKEQYLANMQTFFAATCTYNTAIRAVHGYVTKEVLLMSAVGIIASFGGILIGNRIFDRINAAQQRKMVYVLMLVSGITLLF